MPLSVRGRISFSIILLTLKASCILSSSVKEFRWADQTAFSGKAVKPGPTTESNNICKNSLRESVIGEEGFSSENGEIKPVFTKSINRVFSGFPIKISGLTGLDEEVTARLPPLLMRAVDSVDRDVVGASGEDAVNNRCAVSTEELFPGINFTVSRIDVTGELVDKKETYVAVAVLAGSCKDSVVLAEFNDVVKLEDAVIDLNHGAPPCSVVPEAA